MCVSSKFGNAFSDELGGHSAPLNGYRPLRFFVTSSDSKDTKQLEVAQLKFRVILTCAGAFVCSEAAERVDSINDVNSEAVAIGSPHSLAIVRTKFSHDKRCSVEVVRLSVP